MEEILEAVKTLNLRKFEENDFEYGHIDVFKNPNKLPINLLFLEKVSLELHRGAPLENGEISDDESKYFECKKEIIPALSDRWLPKNQQFPKYRPYNFHSSPEENSAFYVDNQLVAQSLQYLLSCNYHIFWCLVVFEPQVGACLHSFLVDCNLPHQVKYLDDEALTIYLTLFSQFRRVFQRLITFQESEEKYMTDDVGLKLLLDNKLIHLGTVLSLIIFYSETNQEFVNDLVNLYFGQDSIFCDKETEQVLNHIVMTLEMIGGHVCGFEPGALIIPIAIEPKPSIFSLNWIYSLVNYLLCTISLLSALLKNHKSAVIVTLEKGIPYRLTFTYEKVFRRLYEALDTHKEKLEENANLGKIILEEMSLARVTFIDVYNLFISYCLDKCLEFSGNPTCQQEFVEIYLKLMNAALEDEYFICDYHERYDVKLQNEMFASCTEIDDTRTQYIHQCITSLKRYERLWKALKCNVGAIQRSLDKYESSTQIQNGVMEEIEVQPGPSTALMKPAEDEIEQSIRTIIEMFPHLGDAFVLKCLEAYNYNFDDVIAAIIEENLPPHLVDIPYDQVRIPPEPPAPTPLLAYRGHKPDYDDALKLLNDKKDMKQIKSFIMDGIQYGNSHHDAYNDEYDDRDDEEVVPVRDQGSEDILKYNPNYEEVVSDTSYSENEYDDEGQPMAAPSIANRKKKGDFCEDPALLRAQREARRKSQGKPTQSSQPKKRDVVGKTKGQGQDKNVLQNRHNKNTQKSSRANHNRKSGAQWKRNKGMVPS